MAIGFRKSLFGYNTEDVSNHLTKITLENQEIQNALKSRVDDLTNKLSASKAEAEKLSAENLEIKEKLDYYMAKYDEVKNLSENIGKLYLVAQTNAKAIIAAADEAKNTARNEIDQNLTAINATNATLNELKDKITTLNSEFISKVDELNASLLTAKQVIESANKTEQEKLENFDRAYEYITK